MPSSWGGIFEGRMDSIERKQRQNATKQTPTAWDTRAFQVAVSCPPDKSVHVRTGFIWWFSGLYGANGRLIPAQTIDFTWTAKFSTLTTFTTANYYKGVVVGLEQGQQQAGHTYSWFAGGGGGIEYATAAEAEDGIMSVCYNDSPWGSSYPLCGIVLKNDGVTATVNSILPIDAANRGRSYLWRDLRPLNLF